MDDVFVDFQLDALVGRFDEIDDVRTGEEVGDARGAHDLGTDHARGAGPLELRLRGRVLGTGDDLKITVQFPGLGIKRLLQSYAKLKLV